MTHRKFYKLLIRQLQFGVILFLCEFSFAQNEITTSQKMKQLVTFFGEHHLQPAELNDEFGLRVAKNFIEAIDSDRDLFTSEEIQFLRENGVNIDDEAIQGSEAYLNLFKSTFNQAVQRTRQETEKILSSPIDLTSGTDIKLRDNEQNPSLEEFSVHWNFILRSQMLRRVASMLEENNFELKPEQIKMYCDSAQKTLKKSYTDYFKNLQSKDFNLDDIYLNAIAESYDSHSSYFTPEEKEMFREELVSEREIFGINFYKNEKGEFEITEVVPGSSAWLSGEVHAGDIIVSLKFGEARKIELQGFTQFEAHELFSKSDSDHLILEIETKTEKTLTITLVRAKVYSDEDIIKTAVLQGKEKVGYISLPDFYANWTDTSALGCANDVAKALVKLKREEISGLILDLRDNGGGSVMEAVDLVGIFIDYGPIFIAKDYADDVWTMKDFNRGSIYRGPLIVLINEYSASASELVAGALQDYNRALIVGRNSFGKATGQTILSIDPEGPFRQNPTWGFAKITDLALYRINKASNQIKGVQPDVSLLPPYHKNNIFREDSYPCVLHFDSIEKKIYTKIPPPLDKKPLATASHERQLSNQKLQELQQLHAELDSLRKNNYLYSLGLYDYLEIKKKQNEITSTLLKAYEEKVTNFKAGSINFDEDIYSMSEYMNTYREAFLTSVNSDHELSEAYEIMLDLIQQ